MAIQDNEFNLIMKEKHRRLLEKYERYGETNSFFKSSHPKLTRIGKTSATRPLERASKLHIHKQQQKQLILHQGKTWQNKLSSPKFLLCGASIIKGLTRYGPISSSFSKLNAVKIGVVGDRTEHILLRINDLDLPSSIESVFIHCGTNNLLQHSSTPKDTADGILSIGIVAKQKLPNAKISIAGLHHFEE